MNRRPLIPNLPRLHRPSPLASRPRVSVVVPCYNYGHYLPGCLNSVLDQDGVDVDVVVVDDASPDGSGEVAEVLAAEDDRVRVIRHVRNRGHIATYNDGLEAVEGDYVVLLSADDVLTPGALGRATALLERHRDVGFVYGGVCTFTDEPPALSSSRLRSWVVWPGRAWVDRRCRSGRNPITSPEVVMRTSVQREIGGYRPELPHTGDLDMWLRAALVADVGLLGGVVQAGYRVHGSNMHDTTFGLAAPSGLVTDLQQRRVTYERLAAEFDAVDAVGARRGLATEATKLVARTDFATAFPEVAVSLMDFAESTAPEVVGSLWWRAAEAQRGLSGGVRRGVLDVGATALAARDRVRRRCWQPLGG
jgi:hypothetical protein